MTPRSSLSDIRTNFIRRFGELGPFSEAPPSIGQVCGFLIFEGTAFTSAQIAQELALSRGAVSQAVRFLEAQAIVTRFNLPKDRRDYFRFNPPTIDRVVGQMIRLWSKGRQDVEMTLREACATQAPLPEDFVPRLEALAEFYRTFEGYFTEALALHLSRSTSLGAANTNERDVHGDTN